MKYKHETTVHNHISPSIIVPEIIRLISPKSVVDIGCGLGTFLSAFKNLGVNDVLGIDGPWVNKELLYKNINPSEFLEQDLEQEIRLEKKYDLAVSLEVAEHLSPDSADTFVESLINSAEVILFSAAIPLQGGQNHVNEQWLSYWEDKFRHHDYIIHDVVRPIFWDNPDVFTWYKQNMVLIMPRNSTLRLTEHPVPMRNIVHYEMFENKTQYLDNILRGRVNPLLYFKWLAISILGYKFLSRLKQAFSN